MLLIMAALSIYSYSSSIFVFPPVFNYLSKASEVRLNNKQIKCPITVELMQLIKFQFVYVSE